MRRQVEAHLAQDDASNSLLNRPALEVATAWTTVAPGPTLTGRKGGTLRGPRPDWVGRDGRRVSRPRREAAARRRAESSPAVVADRSRTALPLCPRGAIACGPEPSEHRGHLRLRGSRRCPGARAGARRRTHAR